MLSFYGRHATFVSWLAAQSNASMANLESADTWVWTNLVINRERPEGFVDSEQAIKIKIWQGSC